MLIGHQKGRDTKERVRRNYGMPKPEGYRKALRLMRMAERFSHPARHPDRYAGRLSRASAPRSAARARPSRATCSRCRLLRVPIVSVVIGEGGSGGALAIGVCDRLLMLQFSIYSVISPEGCASILWKSTDKKEVAAEAHGPHRRPAEEARAGGRSDRGAAWAARTATPPRWRQVSRPP